jgi:hypothetical protein
MYPGKRIITGAVLLVLPGLYGTVTARALSSEPYSWRNVVIGGGGFVTGIICGDPAPIQARSSL